MSLDHQTELAARLKQLFERAPGFVVLLSGPQHVITYANPGYIALVGGRAVMGRSVSEALPELAEQGFVSLLDQVFASGAPFSAFGAGTRLMGADGRFREGFFDFVYQPVLDDQERVVGVFAQGADVTDRVLAEQALRDREARLELATRAADLGIWDWNLETGEILFGPIARSIWEFPPAGPVTMEMMRRVLHPDDLDDVNERFRRATDPSVRDGSRYEYRLIRHDGTMKWVRAHAMAIFEDRDGAEVAVRYLGTMADVTEEKRREDALRSSEGRLRLALDAGRMAVWSVNEAGVQVTPEFNRILRLPEDARPTLEQLQARYYPGELERLQAASQEVLARGERYLEIEYRHLWPDDTVRWLLVRAEFVMNRSNEPAGAIGVVMDVTARRESEERLLLLAKEVDHRANNLLAVVQGAIWMTRGDDVAAYKDALLGRVTALAHAHQLLASSRWLSADLRSLIAEELRPFCDGSDRCTIEGPDIQLSPSTAQALALAIHELVTNAVKYGALSKPGGSVAVDWTEGSEQDVTVITWRERGGPPVVTPTRRGMGSRVLERALGGAVGGRTQMQWRPEGLVCRLFLGAPSEAAVVELCRSGDGIIWAADLSCGNAPSCRTGGRRSFEPCLSGVSRCTSGFRSIRRPGTARTFSSGLLRLRCVASAGGPSRSPLAGMKNAGKPPVVRFGSPTSTSATGRRRLQGRRQQLFNPARTKAALANAESTRRPFRCLRQRGTTPIQLQERAGAS